MKIMSLIINEEIYITKLLGYHNKATNLIKLSHFSIGVFVVKR